MSISIRKATKKDIPSILELIKELADFENELHEVEISEKDLEIDGFGTHPKFTCFIAEDYNNIKGIALVYQRYSTWKGAALHLEDLIVSKHARGSGIGTLLLDEVVKYAKQINVKRVSWEVLDWNESAISFYEKKGAKVMRDWNVVQLNEEVITNYLSKL